MDWTLRCPCHGKSKTDGEMGVAKNMVRTEQLHDTAEESHKLDSAEQAADFLKEKYAKPSRDILKKAKAGKMASFGAMSSMCQRLARAV